MAMGDTVIKALLTLNVANFLSSLQQANGAVTQTTGAIGKIGQVGSTMTSVGNTLTRNVTLPIVTLGTKAVQTAADFEQAMSMVQALSGATGKDFEDLNAKAREMGATTVYSASESAEAFQFMALAGWDTQQMLAAIDPILKLAGGGMMDLGTTSDIVTDNLTAFGLSADDTQRFTDVLAQTMRSSNTDVLQMGEAFKYVAPLAGTLGFSVEDVSLALGLMANSGIKSSQAGTSLRAALTNLVNPTDKMQQVMDRYGIEVNNADGSMRTLKEIMDNIRSSFSTMTQAEQESAMAMIEQAAGADLAMAAMEGLTDEAKQAQTELLAGEDIIKDWTDAEINAVAASLMGKKELKELSDEQKRAAVATEQGRQALEGLTQSEQAAASASLFGKNALSGMLAIVNASEADYNDLTAAIAGSAGATEELYSVSQDNLRGELANLNSAWEELLIVIGEKLIPMLTPLVEKLIELVGWLSSLDEETIETALAIAGILAIAGPILSILGNVVSLVATLAPGIKLLGTVIAGISGPVGIIIGVVSALVGAFLYLWETNEDFRTAVIEIWENIKQFLSDAVNAIVLFFTETLPEGISSLIVWFQELPGNLIEAISGFAEDVRMWGYNVSLTFMTWVSETVANVLQFFKDLPGNIATAINVFFTETLPTWGKNVLEAGKTAVNAVVDALIYIFSELPFDILIAIRDAVRSFITWGKEVLTQAKITVAEITANIITWFQELPGRIYDAIVDTVNTIIDWGKEVFKQATITATEITANIISFFKELPGNIYDAIVDAIDKLTDWGEDMYKAAGEAVSDVVDGIVEWFTELPDKIYDVGKYIVEGLWDGITSMGSWISDKIDTFCSNIYDGIVEFFEIGSPSKLLEEGVGKWIPPGIAVGMEDNLDSLKPATESISDTITHGLNDNVGSTMDSFVSNMGNALSAITGASAGIGSTLLSATQDLGDSVQSPFVPSTDSSINIDQIIVRSEDDLTMLSRGLFNRDVATLRALGRA